MPKLNYDLISHSHPYVQGWYRNYPFQQGCCSFAKLYLKMSTIIYSLSQKGPYNNSEDKFCLVKRSIHIFFSNNENYTPMYFPVYFLLLGNRLLDWPLQIPHGTHPFWFLSFCLRFSTLKVLCLIFYFYILPWIILKVHGMKGILNIVSKSFILRHMLLKPGSIAIHIWLGLVRFDIW